MVRRVPVWFPLVDRPPKVPIRDLGRCHQAVFVVGIGLAVVAGFTISVVVLYIVGLVGIIDAQANTTGDFALISWVGSTYLIGLTVTDWVRRRATRGEQHDSTAGEP